jgi:phospholipase C
MRCLAFFLALAACGRTGGHSLAPSPLGHEDPAPAVASKINHVVVIVQENHAFDTYFGRYCRAPAGSHPSCDVGPDCCEAAPAADPSGAAPVVLDDDANATYDPTHTQACEASEIDGGAMDRFVHGADCAAAGNFALAPDALVGTYHAYAAAGALADRYFQPIVGASSSNDMYFAAARYVFTDNEQIPTADGAECSLAAVIGGPFKALQQELVGKKTIADLLLDAGFSFSMYSEGYAALVDAAPRCPQPPRDCTVGLAAQPCNYDPADIPFAYYEQLSNNPDVMKDYSALARDLATGHLPNLSFVKSVGYHSEHPGWGTTISQGAVFVDRTVQLIAHSTFADDTLVLLTWDEGGGFYDHVSPPPTSAVDGQPYGTRVPLIALGPFARAGVVSHVTLEHSSVVRFVERNFLGATGQLGGRDAEVEDITSLLDPKKTGL